VLFARPKSIRRLSSVLPDAVRGSRTEDLQTVEESVPERTLRASLAARADLMAGFTAERDMGTEGAGSADTAVRDAINRGLIPGPRLRISGNAIDILGGHEDAIHFNPAQQIASNANYDTCRSS
jgi:imidazolonepropionase-like amidohydrolase